MLDFSESIYNYLCVSVEDEHCQFDGESKEKDSKYRSFGTDDRTWHNHHDHFRGSDIADSGSRDGSRDREDVEHDQDDEKRDANRRGRGRRSRNITAPTVYPNTVDDISKAISKACTLM